jgi:hypothetical protein
MSKNRIKIESKDLEGNDVVVYAVRPTAEETAKAQMASNKTFKKALINGAMVRKTLEAELESQGIWNDEKQEKLEGYQEEIREHLTALKTGGIKLTEARDLAIKVRIARMEALTLQSEKNEYDSYTAEAQAEGAKITALVSMCLKNEKGESVFKDEDDYREKQEEPWALEGASKLATMVYGIDEGWEADLPENKFLKKYGFVDENLRLIDKTDKFYVTIDGKRINENFQYVDEEGNLVDVDGNRVDDDGLPIVEAQPFLDDDGQPIVEEEEAEETEEAEDSSAEESAE